jgi:hypothetical protein
MTSRGPPRGSGRNSLAGSSEASASRSVTTDAVALPRPSSGPAMSACAARLPVIERGFPRARSKPDVSPSGGAVRSPPVAPLTFPLNPRLAYVHQTGTSLRRGGEAHSQSRASDSVPFKAPAVKCRLVTTRRYEPARAALSQLCPTLDLMLGRGPARAECPPCEITSRSRDGCRSPRPPRGG